MLGKIAKMIGDNGVLDLLSGKVVVTDEVINAFVNMKGLPPEVSSVEIKCGDGHVTAAARGEFKGIEWSFTGGAELKGLRVTADEQVVRIMPRGPIKAGTKHQEVIVNFWPGEGLMREYKTLLDLAPPEIAGGVIVEEDSIKLLLHAIPQWKKEFDRMIAELPLTKKLGINPLDYVVIKDLVFVPGAVRIVAGRK